MKLRMLTFILLTLSACGHKPDALPVGKRTDTMAGTRVDHQKPASVFSMPATKKMMATNRFWNLIDASNDLNGNLDEQAIWLQDTLAKLPVEDIIGFRLRTDRLMAETYDGNLWCAAYLINRGASDEEFEFFRLWLIAQGKKVFEDARQHPDVLVRYVKAGEKCQFEPLWYVPVVAFESRTGAVLYDFIDKSFPEQEGYYEPITLGWSEDKPESMRRLCPALFEKFMH